MTRRGGRILRLLLAVCIAVWMIIPASASELRNYRIESSGWSIELPESYEIFSRKISDNDTRLEEYGLTKEVLLSVMEEENLFLAAFDSGLESSITVAVARPDDFSDIESIDDSTLLEKFESNLQRGNAECESMDFYYAGGLKYVKFHAARMNNVFPAYQLSYYTLRSGSEIYINFFSYTGRISVGQEALMKRIVNSVRFDEAAAQLSQEADVPAEKSPGLLQIIAYAPLYIWCLLIILLSVSFPSILYRYVFRKRPLDRKKAKAVLCICVVFMIVCIYAAFLAEDPWTTFGTFIPSQIALWINYKILVGSRRKRKAQEMPDASEPAAPPQVPYTPESAMLPDAPLQPAVYCPRCGAKLLENSAFCHRCGAKLPGVDDETEYRF